MDVNCAPEESTECGPTTRWDRNWVRSLSLGTWNVTSLLGKESETERKQVFIVGLHCAHWTGSESLCWCRRGVQVDCGQGPSLASSRFCETQMVSVVSLKCRPKQNHMHFR